MSNITYIDCHSGSCTSYPITTEMTTIAQYEPKGIKMETYAWAGLNFTLYCVGIAILIGMFLLVFDTIMVQVRRSKEQYNEFIKSLMEDNKPRRR